MELEKCFIMQRELAEREKINSEKQTLGLVKKIPSAMSEDLEEGNERCTLRNKEIQSASKSRFSGS